MTLLDAYTQECVLLTQTRTDDAAGGHSVTWADGAHFMAAWAYQAAPEETAAEKQGVNRVYRIFVDKAVNLDFHQVFLRMDNGHVYRVTNPGDDRHTPASSALNRRVIEVEEWELPYQEAQNA